MADTTTELEVLDEIVDVLGGQSGQYETVVPTLQQIRDLLGGGGGGGYNPSLSVGRADALTGADSTAQWATRESTGNGAATIRSVQGAAEVQDGELVPVRIAGMKSIGFNQWDEEWELGSLDADGQPASGTSIRSKNFIPVVPSTAYYIAGLTSGVLRPFYYDSEKAFISRGYWSGGTANNPFTVPSTARYMKFSMASSYGSTYNNDICINISDPALNGQYKPYTSDAIEWPTQTLRAAGSVADMLYSDHVDVRVGVVDLGTLTWTYNSELNVFAGDIHAMAPLAKVEFSGTCLEYPFVGSYRNRVDKSSFFIYNVYVGIQDTSFNSDEAALKASLAGVLLYYELATPTTTPISPALPMTYRVEQGGSESIIVPAGEVSAAPVITVAEGESAAELVMDALACIATPDGPVATSNHALGTYLTMQGKLYKVTSAIAVGETIKSGTNVTETTVMAELIARTA